MSDFRDRFGAQLAAAAAALGAAAEDDFRVRFGAQLATAAAELAGGREPVAAPLARRSGLGRGRRGGLPRLGERQLAPGLVLADFRARFGLQLARAAGELAANRHRRPAQLRQSRRWPWLTRPVAVGLALTAFAGTAFAAVAIWTPLLGNQQYGYNPGAATSAPPEAQLDALAVLRRPQTDADRGALSQAALTYINDYTSGVRTAYVRLLATVGDTSFVLVPVEERDATAAAGEAPTESTPLANALCVYASDADDGHTGVRCWALADVIDGHAAATFEGQFFGLAPDGATTATLSTGVGPTISAPVSSNFFALALPSNSSPPPMNPSVSFTGSGN
jgi:hypothetical protein